MQPEVNFRFLSSILNAFIDLCCERKSYLRDSIIPVLRDDRKLNVHANRKGMEHSLLSYCQCDSAAVLNLTY